MGNDYREGHETVPEETVGKASDEHKDEIKEIPLTAVLVLKFKDRMDVVRDIPGLSIDHAPSMQEIRDMCQSVAADAQGSMVTMKFTESLAKAAEAREQHKRGGKNRIVVPGRKR